MHPKHAADGILRFAARAASLRVEATSSAAKINRYAGIAGFLVGPDARRRWEECLAVLAAEDGSSQYLPSPHRVAESSIHEEERHSLVLAWLLDPGRSGAIGRAFWTGFRDVVLAAASSQEELGPTAAAVRGWPAAPPADWFVQPLRYKAEKHNFDVFGRDVASEDEAPRTFALLIENKVRSETDEQEGQLDTYYSRVEERYGPAALERTVFVFLAEKPREPRRAKVHADRWVRLGWGAVEGALRVALVEGELSAAERLWVRQYCDAIREEILGLPSRAMVEEAVRSLRPRVQGRDAQDAAWRNSHEEILRLWRTVREVK